MEKRFPRSGSVAIPQTALAKYQVKQAATEIPEGAVAVTAAPRTSNAQVAAAPHVAGAAQSERERASWWRSTIEDPALLVGVGVCVAAYVAVRFMKR